MPPAKLKPASAGYSKCSGQPTAGRCRAAAGRRSARGPSASIAEQLLAGSPSARARPAAQAASASDDPRTGRAMRERIGAGARQIGSGIDKPRLVRKDAVDSEIALPRAGQRARARRGTRRRSAAAAACCGSFRHRPRRSAQQPVRRQPRDADEEADDGGEDDAERRHQQRVVAARPGRRGRRCRSGIGNQRLDDVEAGGRSTESRSRMRCRAREVGRACWRRSRSRSSSTSSATSSDLDGKSRSMLARPPWRCVRMPCGRSCDMARRSPGWSDGTSPAAAGAPAGQRIGGAYCRPPLFHSALRPRAILSGEPAPTLRSKISP